MLDFFRSSTYNQGIKKETSKNDRKTIKRSQKKQGVSVSTVKKWEQDQVDPNTAALISIAVALNVSIDYLFGNTPETDLVVVANNDIKRIIEVVEGLPQSHREALFKYAELLTKGNDNV